MQRENAASPHALPSLPPLPFPHHSNRPCISRHAHVPPLCLCPPPVYVCVYVCLCVHPTGEASLERYRPRTYGGETVGGRSLAAAGCVPILHMRNFQRSQGRRLGPDLLQDIASRHTAR